MTAAGQDRRVPAAPVRSAVGLALRLTRQWWPHLLSLAAACGIVAATIAGALGVGDALTQGLRRLALARLGGIQAAVLSDGFFRAELADETTNRLRSQAATENASAADVLVPAIVPAIVMEVSLEGAATGDRAGRSARATLLACDDLPALGFSPPQPFHQQTQWRSIACSPAVSALGLATRSCSGSRSWVMCLLTARWAVVRLIRGAGGCGWRRCCRPMDSGSFRCGPRR
jgi:hypothetical protein